MPEERPGIPPQMRSPSDGADSSKTSCLGAAGQSDIGLSRIICLRGQPYLGGRVFRVEDVGRRRLCADARSNGGGILHIGKRIEIGAQQCRILTQTRSAAC